MIIATKSFLPLSVLKLLINAIHNLHIMNHAEKTIINLRINAIKKGFAIFMKYSSLIIINDRNTEVPVAIEH